MNPASVSQFLTILAIAFGALVACPIVVFFAEGLPASGTRREKRQRQRRISTQHPVMQY